MSTDTARPSLRTVGYRRAILVAGALWGAVPALSFGVRVGTGLESGTVLLALGAAMTFSLGLLYELDSRRLTAFGEGVPLAWAYALVAPISAAFWATFGPVLAGIPVLSSLILLIGPPASALLYVWQRGRVASVE